MLVKKKKEVLQKPLVKKGEKENLLPVSLMLLAGSTVVLAIAFCWIALQVSRIASQNPPTLVQSSLGESFVAVAKDYEYREPELLQNTAKEWLILIFSWGEPASDVPGSIELVDYENEQISLAAYKASMLLSDSFRDDFLTNYTEEVFTDEATRGALASLYVPLQVLPPVELSPGRWEVEVLGSRYITTPNSPAGKMKPANFLIEFMAADVPQSPLKEDASSAVKAVYSFFEAGVRITNVQEIHHATR